MGSHDRSTERQGLLELLSGLDVGSATITSDGFVGLVGRTGLSMRVGGPTELDTVRVWAVLSVPATRSTRDGSSPSGHADSWLLGFVNGLNRDGCSGARFFHAGAVASGDWVIAESVVPFVSEGDGAALVHAIRLFELEVNSAVLAIARAFP